MSAETVEIVPFGVLPDGSTVQKFVLDDGVGTQVCVIEFGATIISLITPDRNNQMADVVLGFDTLDDYLAPGPYFGAVVGRYANRIRHGRLCIDGQWHSLSRNEGDHHLHGGIRGFDKSLWHGECGDGARVELSLVSADSEEGYPGTVHAGVSYTLSAGCLTVRYTATSDAATVLNLAQHSYFNLAGHASGPVTDHTLMLAASHYTPVDAALLPTGEILTVENTPFDFRRPQRVGAQIKDRDVQLERGQGYDHNFVLSEPLSVDGLRTAAVLSEPDSGRVLTVRSDQPGVQFYSGNQLDGSLHGKDGCRYARHSGLCLETQTFPDAPNHPHFPSAVLRPGERYATTTLFQFSVNHAQTTSNASRP